MSIDQSIYAPPLGEVVRQLLIDNIGYTTFVKYFYGDPVQIPTSVLPCMMVCEGTSQTTQDATGLDEITTPIIIKVCYNKKTDFKLNSNDITGEMFLKNTIEGIDKVTGEYEAHSIRGILRKNFTLGNTVFDNQITVRPVTSIRPDQILTAERWVICTFKQLIVVSGRV